MSAEMHFWTGTLPSDKFLILVSKICRQSDIQIMLHVKKFIYHIFTCKISCPHHYGINFKYSTMMTGNCAWGKYDKWIFLPFSTFNWWHHCTRMESLNPAVFEILHSKHTAVTSWTFQGHVTIWKPICHFLLVVLWNLASISNGFRDIQWRM